MKKALKIYISVDMEGMAGITSSVANTSGRYHFSISGTR